MSMFTMNIDLWNKVPRYRFADFTSSHLGVFSINTYGKMFGINDTSCFRRLKDPLPSPPIDLLRDFQSNVEGHTTEENYHYAGWSCFNFLKWRNAAVSDPQIEDKLSDINVYTQRGILRVMANLYILIQTGRIFHEQFFMTMETLKRFRFHVGKFQDKLFIRRISTEELTKYKSSIYVGERFEEVMTDGPTNEELQSNANFNVLKISMKNSPIIILASAQADCMTESGETVELKTCTRGCFEYNNFIRYENWCISVLSNTHILGLGIREEREEPLTQIIMEPLSEYPTKYNLSPDLQDNILSYLFELLEWVYSKVPDDNGMWVLAFEAETREIVLRKIVGTETEYFSDEQLEEYFYKFK